MTLKMTFCVFGFPGHLGLETLQTSLAGEPAPCRDIALPFTRGAEQAFAPQERGSYEPVTVLLRLKDVCGSQQSVKRALALFHGGEERIECYHSPRYLYTQKHAHMWMHSTGAPTPRQPHWVPLLTS